MLSTQQKGLTGNHVSLNLAGLKSSLQGSILAWEVCGQCHTLQLLAGAWECPAPPPRGPGGPQWLKSL